MVLLYTVCAEGILAAPVILECRDRMQGDVMYSIEFELNGYHRMSFTEKLTLK